MTLRLGPGHAEQVRAHVQGNYPEEACGLLVGRESDGVRHVERVVAVDNVRQTARQRRYLIAPEKFLEVEREARSAGLDVLGFFHSHPDHPARPSAFDLEHAWPWYSYVIVSIERGTVTETRSWRLLEDRSRFEPERLELPQAGAREREGGSA